MSQYYLIGDPDTGKVTKRSHDLLMPHEPGIALRVTKPTWNKYRAGDEVDIDDLDAHQGQRWTSAQLSAKRCRLY